MKKVLWIACLLFVMPFLGYSQNHAGLAPQDDEVLFGPGPASKELPSHIQLNNIQRTTRDGNAIWAHVMFVPSGNHHYGVYWQISEDGTVTQVQRYNENYYSSAEYYKPYPASQLDEELPVWAYADDHLLGYNRMSFVEGDVNGTNKPVLTSMNELTYDYYHNAPGREGRMLGLKYGKIYLINMNWDTPEAGQSTVLYDDQQKDANGNYIHVDDNGNTIRPIAMACDLDGTLYFVSLSQDGETPSKLYKFEADDQNLTEPIEVGEFDWAAQHIQTMAFDHRTRELFWWQCDINNNTNLVRINGFREDNVSTEIIATTETCEMAGLIFEFQYRPYTAYCIEAEEGTILLRNGNAYNLQQNDYKPAKDVEFKVTSNSCYSIETVYVYAHGTTTDPIYTIPADDLVNGVGHFSMPACDVDIVGEWVGNEHGVELTWTPTSLVDALTMDGTTAQCGDQVTVTYDHPAGYFLTNITVMQGNTNIPVTEINKENSTISFEMPDGDVVVNASYSGIILEQTPDICQYEALKTIPNGGHTLNKPHDHTYTFTDPDGNATTYGPTGVYNSSANHPINAIIAALTFDIPGTWTYTTAFISQKYGSFSTDTKSFMVYPAPRSIAIQEEFIIDAEAVPQVIYNPHYNCAGDSIYLKVIADPEDYVFNGTFVWTKDGNEIATTTEPELLIKPCNENDGGNYNVTYTPNTGENTTAQEPICDFPLDEDFPVNVKTIPNNPRIEIQGSNPICYKSSAVLEWKYGVLNPDEYDIKWEKLDENGEWQRVTVKTDEEGNEYEFVYPEDAEVEYASDVLLTTLVLEGPATYRLQINYASDGAYYLCHSESDPFTIEVKEETLLEFEGATETCQGINPEGDEQLHVVGDYTNFSWSFNGTPLNETSNTLHFDNYDLVSEVGTFWVEVSAEDAEGCTIYGEIQFTIMDLPNVRIANDIQPLDTAYWNDDPILQITVCKGKLVTLRGFGADRYIWGEGLNHTEASFYQVIANNNTTVSAQGFNDETGCWNTASIEIIVNQLPEVAWVLPSQDTTFSMITDEYQLVATPAGGIFTYITPDDPNNDIPIEGGLLKPSELGIGDYQLIYKYTDENGCQSEQRIRNISIVKPYWSDPDQWNPTWYEDCDNDGGRFEITSPADLGSFWAYLYGLNGVTQNNFEGDTIWIDDNIDLQAKPNFSRPFCDTAVFKGVIDGLGHVVSNMVILENDLTMYVDGFIRNVGVKDAKITSVGNECVVDVNPDARFHNSYITMPELVNVIPQLNPMQHMLPTGEVRNVYYYGKIGNFPMPLAVYLDNGVTPIKLIANVPSYDLLHIDEDKVEDINYTGILEEWVWLQNDFYYYTWMTDAATPAAYENYGYPMLEKKFIHHHYVNVEGCDEAEFELGGDIKYRTINNVEYTYIMNEENLEVTFTPNTYVNVKEVTCNIIGWNGTDDITDTYAVNNNEVTIEMPKDSVYMPAYEVFITTECARDYWTDGPAELGPGNYNYNPNWYSDCQADGGRWEITSNEDLAALAWEVDFGGHDFDGDTVWIVGSETPNSQIIDMTGHFWRPIYGFKGVLNGTKYIVDNLFIRENENAMFVDMDGAIINLGIQDPDVPADGNVATFVFNTSNNYNASVINGFATWDPTTGLELPIANEGVSVTNTYTLDSNGNMYYPNAPEAVCDLVSLRDWVIAENNYLFLDWTTDDDMINYNYPIHDKPYDGGWTITYIPSIYDHNADPDGVPGYVDGPTTAHYKETVTVGTFPNYCHNCTELWLIDPEQPEPIDILNTHQFVMPNHPVTVQAVFLPIDWTLTINYVVADDPTQNPEPYVGTYHYQDEISIASPELADYEPVEGFEVVELVMPCGHKTVTVNYIGKEHNINFCQYIMTYAKEYGTDHENDIARFNDEVTIDIVAKDGMSIPNNSVTIMTADGREVDFTGDNGHYTFTMPNDDVTICAEFTEEFWDDYGIADIDWFIGHEDDDTYVLTTDSMLGGLAALTSSRPWLVEQGYYTEEEVAGFNFAGKTILVESAQEEGMIDLIEHKWRPIGAQVLYTKYFQGYFDGQNTEIVNMTTADYTILPESNPDSQFNEYSENGSCQAFFGNVGDEAVITNLHIQGKAIGRYFTAGIAGVNYGTIINSVANVNVYSEFEAGGIVGNNFGMLLNNYCIADTVNCMAAMPLRSTNNEYIGGVAAYNGGVITNCHSVAELVRGGTMGNNPINYYGGVVGMNDNDMVSYCYWKVNPVEDGVGGGHALVNCAVINDNTANAMNTKAQELAAEYGYEFNGWIMGEDGYPVFDLSRMVMNNNESNINVNLYPNPTKDIVNIFSDNIQRVTVFNMFGQMVLDTEVNANQTTINMTGFSAGIYMVRIATAEGTTTRNVVVE